MVCPTSYAFTGTVKYAGRQVRHTRLATGGGGGSKACGTTNPITL